MKDTESVNNYLWLPDAETPIDCMPVYVGSFPFTAMLLLLIYLRCLLGLLGGHRGCWAPHLLSPFPGVLMFTTNQC